MIGIKGMEMPERCIWDCPLAREDGGACQLADVRTSDKERPKECPLVQIVMCKDCKHWDKCSTPRVPDEKEYHYCPMEDFNTAEDYFCAYGERKA